MINFEKELKNFQPSLEVEEAEAAIYNHDLTDVTDITSEWPAVRTVMKKRKK